MTKIDEEIGRKIRIYRKKKGMTLQELADAICKSKPSVSKYELGQVSIDISTMYDIARALNIHVEQLLYVPPAAPACTSKKQIPAFFQGQSQFYFYVYDGRINSISRSIVDILSQTEPHVYKIMMYMNFQSYDCYQDCENTYYGYLKHYDTLSHLILQHQNSPIEQFMITLPFSYRNTEKKWGLSFGLSTRPMIPCAAKILFSRRRLEENEELRRELMLSRDDIRTLRLYNMLTVI